MRKEMHGGTCLLRPSKKAPGERAGGKASGNEGKSRCVHEEGLAREDGFCASLFCSPSIRSARCSNSRAILTLISRERG